MAENQPPEGENPPGSTVEDRSDETLTPQEAYRLRENIGLQNKTVAKMFGVTPGYVSQLYNQYQEAHEEGRESVAPTDFERGALEEALEDSESASPYHTTCPQCEEEIPTPEEAGQNPCPECGVTLNWSEDEL